MSRTTIEKVLSRPPFKRRFDRGGTTVRCADGFSRLRRHCVELEPGVWVPKTRAAA